jgi:hypothetical protein
LPSRLPVSQAEAAEGVVVTGATDLRGGDKSRLLVATLAELCRIVAIAATRLARVRRSWVANEESLSMVARLPGTFGAVTFETGGSHVAGLARHRSGVGFSPMPLAERP